MHQWLMDIARIGIGLAFIASVVFDVKSKPQIFELMQKKKVPMPKFFFMGASFWKTLTGVALVFSFYTFWAALLLALYVFIANVIFNNFWAIPKEHRGFPISLFITYTSVCFGLLAIGAAYYHFA